MCRKKCYSIFLITISILVLSACTSLREKGFSATDILKELSSLDKNDSKTAQINRGKELFDKTKTVLPKHVGNDLSCISCHGEGGLAPNSPMVGVTQKYPKNHHGKWTTIEDRINGCFVRSMNGKMIEEDSEDMKSFVAYFEFISKDVKSEKDITWRMDNNKKQVPVPDLAEGERLFKKKNCISCHAADGSGSSDHTGPALWGEGSFNEAAGMNRLNKATGFIQNNMPKGEAGTLTDQEAANLAAFILSHERPEGDPEKLGDYHKSEDRDYMFKERREKLWKGEFDWTELDVVKSASH